MDSAIANVIVKLKGHVVSVAINARKEITLISTSTGALCAKVTQDQLSIMASRGLIQYKGKKIQLTQEAECFLTRRAAKDRPFAEQHSSIQKVHNTQKHNDNTLMRNIDESPLSGLYRRKTKSGNTFLTQNEFQAGERLRRDFTFGSLMPSITMQWAEKSSGVGRSAPNDMSDETFAARQRVNHALKAVGPDLGSILIDVCCFLKGMETVEKERQWPVRSAKVVLKTALIALDRHYNPDGRPIPPQYTAIRSMEMYA